MIERLSKRFESGLYKYRGCKDKGDLAFITILDVISLSASIRILDQMQKFQVSGDHTYLKSVEQAWETQILSFVGLAFIYSVTRKLWDRYGLVNGKMSHATDIGMVDANRSYRQKHALPNHKIKRSWTGSYL